MKLLLNGLSSVPGICFTWTLKINCCEVNKESNLHTANDTPSKLPNKAQNAKIALSALVT
jgi:hypothetical protein